jgi:hypothetical protein
MNSEKFELQFDPKLIPSLVDQYMTTGDGAAKDEKMEKAGQHIAAGQRTLENLEIIYRWKSTRSVGHLARNKPQDIDQCLKQAVEAGDENAAMTALVRVSAKQTGLHGVQVPVASAILTAIDPKRFTVIDYKALDSLGHPQPSPNIDFYLEYLSACRDIATAQNIGLRTLDRALWQSCTNKEKKEQAKKSASKSL